MRERASYLGREAKGCRHWIIQNRAQYEYVSLSVFVSLGFSVSLSPCHTVSVSIWVQRSFSRTSRARVWVVELITGGGEKYSNRGWTQADRQLTAGKWVTRVEIVGPFRAEKRAQWTLTTSWPPSTNWQPSPPLFWGYLSRETLESRGQGLRESIFREEQRSNSNKGDTDRPELLPLLMWGHWRWNSCSSVRLRESGLRSRQLYRSFKLVVIEELNLS